MRKLLLIAMLMCPSVASSQVAESILGGGYIGLQEPVVFLVGPNGSCTGAVIGKKTILSAAHCIAGFAGSPLLAGIGGKYYTVKRGYRGPFDLALFTTTKRISGRRYKVVKNSFPRIGQVVAVFGFGQPEIGFLKYTFMQVIGYESSGSFVAGSLDGSTTCSGDSGGPAIVNDRGRLLVLGVVSRGQSSCGVGSSTAFGATGSTRGFKWISNKLKSIDM